MFCPNLLALMLPSLPYFSTSISPLSYFHFPLFYLLSLCLSSRLPAFPYSSFAQSWETVIHINGCRNISHKLFTLGKNTITVQWCYISCHYTITSSFSSILISPCPVFILIAAYTPSFFNLLTAPHTNHGSCPLYLCCRWPWWPLHIHHHWGAHGGWTAAQHSDTVPWQWPDHQGMCVLLPVAALHDGPVNLSHSSEAQNVLIHTNGKLKSICNNLRHCVKAITWHFYDFFFFLSLFLVVSSCAYNESLFPSF